MTIELKLDGQRLSFNGSEKPIVSGTQKFIKLHFDLDDNWNDLLTFAQFTQKESYNVYLDEDNSVYLPTEIEDGLCTLSLCGTKDDIRATSSAVAMIIDKSRLIQDGKSTEISQTLYEQLVNRIEWGNALGIDHIAIDESKEDGGTNRVTFYFTDGTSQYFDTLNGSKGSDGWVKLSYTAKS